MAAVVHAAAPVIGDAPQPVVTPPSCDDLMVDAPGSSIRKEGGLRVLSVCMIVIPLRSYVSSSDTHCCPTAALGEAKRPIMTPRRVGGSTPSAILSVHPTVLGKIPAERGPGDAAVIAEFVDERRQSRCT